MSGGKFNDPLRYSKAVENRVREGVQSGLTRRAILDSIQHLQDAPKSLASLYKYYSHVFGEEEFKLKKEIGDAVMKGVREGNPKLVEFAARARAGWNPVERVQEVSDDEAEERSDAVSTLASLLGKNVEDTNNG